jgi:glutaredoxin
MFRLLGRLFRGPQLEHLHFVLFTRQGCHLCEEGERLLQKQQERYHFKLEVVDVDSKKELADQFGEQVPVVAVNGQIRFHGQINPVLLTRLLKAEAGGSRK